MLVKRSREHSPLSFTRLLVMFCIYENFNPLNSKVYGNMPSKEEDAAFLISRHIRFMLRAELMAYEAAGTRDMLCNGMTVLELNLKDI